MYLRQYYLTLCIRWLTLRELFSIVPETVSFDSVYQVINFETIIFYCTWDSIIWLCVSGDQLWENCFLLYLRQYYLTLCIRWLTLRELFSIVPETVLFDSVYQVINFERIIFYCTWDSIIWLCVSGDQLWENCFLLYLRQYYLTLCIRWSTLRQLFSIVPETVLFDSVYQVINFETIIFYCTWDSIIWLCVSGDQLWENCFLLYLRQYHLTLCIRWSTLRQLFSIVPETVLFDSVYQVINFETIIFYCTWDSIIWLCVSGDQLWENCFSIVPETVSFDSVYQVINFEKTVFLLYLRQYYLTLCIRWSTLRKLFFYCTWDSIIWLCVSGDQLWENCFSIVPETVLFDSVYQVINFEKTVFSCTWDSIIWLCVSGDQLWENCFYIVPETVLFDSVYQVINFEKTVFILYLRQYYLTLCIRWSTLRKLFLYCTWDSIIWLCVSGDQLWENCFYIVPETVLFDSVYQVINFEKTVFILYLRQYYLTLCIRWSTLRQLFSIVPETVLFDSVYQVMNFEKTVFSCTWDSIIWLCVSGDELWENCFLLYLRQYYLTLCIRWWTCRMRCEPSMWRPWAWGWTHRPQARPSWTVSWTHLDPVGLSLDLNVQRSRDVPLRRLESV